MLEMDHQDRCRLNNRSIFDFFLTEIQDGENHSFSNVSNSHEINFSKEIWILSAAMGIDTMSCFSSLTAEQKQLLHAIVVLKVLE